MYDFSDSQVHFDQEMEAEAQDAIMAELEDQQDIEEDCGE